VRAYTVDSFPEVFPECVRALLAVGRRDDALRAGDLDRAAEARHIAAHALAVDGQLESSPEAAVRTLGEAIEAYRALEMELNVALSTFDLGRATAAAGGDPRSAFERAREGLIACDARLYLPDVDAALAALDGD